MFLLDDTSRYINSDGRDHFLSGKNDFCPSLIITGLSVDFLTFREKDCIIKRDRLANIIQSRCNKHRIIQGDCIVDH